MVVGECVTGSGCVWLVVECVTGSVGVCGWEWRSVWLGMGECVDGSGGVCNWEWGV